MNSHSKNSASIPPSIAGKISDFRRQLAAWIFTEGVGRLLVVIIAVGLIDLAIDWMFRMDIYQRAILLLVIAGLVAYLSYRWIIRPLTRRPSDDAIILEIEDSHRDLDESVISAVQFSRAGDLSHQGVSQELVQATIDQGIDRARSIDFGDALNRDRLRTNRIVLASGAIVVAMLVIGVLVSDSLNIWFKRNVLLTGDQWPRATELVIRDVDGSSLVLARGEDYKQFVEVSEKSRVRDVNVYLEFDEGSFRRKQKMKQNDALDRREHEYVFRNVSNEFRFRAIGGDHTTDWIDVTLVDPPMLTELQIVAHLPSYTGIENQPLPVGSGPHVVLEGSSLTFTGVCNKPLQTANLLRDSDSIAFDIAGGTQISLTLAAEQVTGGTYRVELIDSDGRPTSRPTTIQIKTKPDQPPKVRAGLVGIGGLVVPHAKIPVAFNAADEFAITQTGFQFRWKSAEEGAELVEGEQLMPALAAEYGQPRIKSRQIFEMRGLAIPADVSLRLNVRASDNNIATGPGVGKSREFLLRVVSEEELRADLLRREIEQRRAFERALEKQEKLTVEMRALRANLAQDGGSMDAKKQADLKNEFISFSRRQKSIGTSIASVATRFEGYLAEAENNRLDESPHRLEGAPTLQDRFRDRIIVPIRELDGTELVGANRGIDQSRRSVNDPVALLESVDSTTRIQDVAIQKMRSILAAMEDSETYQGIVNKLIEVKRSEEDLLQMAIKKKGQTSEDEIFDAKPDSGKPDGDEDKKRDDNDDDPFDKDETSDDPTASGGDSGGG